MLFQKYNPASNSSSIDSKYLLNGAINELKVLIKASQASLSNSEIGRISNVISNLESAQNGLNIPSDRIWTLIERELKLLNKLNPYNHGHQIFLIKSLDEQGNYNHGLLTPPVMVDLNNRKLID